LRDWVESCTALVEHEDGRFEIITSGAIRAARSAGAAVGSRAALILLIRASCPVAAAA